MTPTEKGRYCAVCQREIYDFTKLTHRQLAQRLKRNENVCGVFRKDQLDVDLYAGLDFDLQKLGTVATISTILLTSQATLAQSNETQVKTEQRIYQDKGQTLAIDSTKLVSYHLKGTVVEKGTGDTIPGVNVIVKSINIGTHTDFDGSFSLNFEADPSKPVVLEVSMIGFQTQEIKIDDPNQNINISIEMNIQLITTTLTGVVVVHKRNIFQRTGDFFRRLFRKKAKKPDSCQVK